MLSNIARKYFKKPGVGSWINRGFAISKGLVGFWLLNSRGNSLKDISRNNDGVLADFWNVNSEFNALPTAEGWNFYSADSEASVASVSGGILTLDTLTTMRTASYMKPGGFDNARGYTIEFRLKIVQFYLVPFEINIIDGTYDSNIQIGKTSIICNGGAPVAWTATNWTTYKIEVIGSSFKLYANGSVIATNAPTPDLSGFDEFHFGGITSAETKTEIEYIRIFGKGIIDSSATSWRQGKEGISLYNNGQRYAAAGAKSCLDITDEITLEAIVDTNALDGYKRTILSKKSFTKVNYELCFNAGKLQFSADKAASNVVGYYNSDIRNTGTRHVAFRFSRTRQDSFGKYNSLFLDGKPIAITFSTGSDASDALQAVSDQLYLGAAGAYGAVDFFKGVLNHVRIWSRALRDEEISQIFQQQYSMITGRKKLAGIEAPATTTGGATGYELRFYDAKYNKVGILSSKTSQRILSSCSFELLLTGCGAFNMTLVDLPDFGIIRNDIIEVFLMGQSDPFYVGYIHSVPEEGKTDKIYNFSGYGFVGKLDEVVISKKYTYENALTIAADLLNTYIIPNTEIINNPAKIEYSTFNIEEADFELVKCKGALSDLANAAVGSNGKAFLTGVDEFREFFFLEISDAIQLSAVKAIEKHVDSFAPKEDATGIANKIYIKSSKVSDGSNYKILVEDATSQAAYGIKEGIESAPTMSYDADVQRWADRILSMKKDPVITASVKNIDITKLGEKIRAFGKARILLRKE